MSKDNQHMEACRGIVWWYVGVSFKRSLSEVHDATENFDSRNKGSRHNTKATLANHVSVLTECDLMCHGVDVPWCHARTISLSDAK